MAGAVISYLSAGTGDMPALIAAFAAPAEPATKPRIDQSPLNGIQKNLEHLNSKPGTFDDAYLATLRLQLLNPSSAGRFETLLGFRSSDAGLIRLLTAFRATILKVPPFNEVLRRAREQVSDSPWTKARLRNEKDRLNQSLLAIEDVRKETRSSYLLVEQTYKAFGRIAENARGPVADQLRQFQEFFSERLGGIVRTEQFASDIDDLISRRRYLTLAYAAQYLTESGWIEGATGATRTTPSSATIAASNLRLSISGKMFGGPARQSVNDQQVADIVRDLRALREMMSAGTSLTPSPAVVDK